MTDLERIADLEARIAALAGRIAERDSVRSNSPGFNSGANAAHASKPRKGSNPDALKKARASDAPRNTAKPAGRRGGFWKPEFIDALAEFGSVTTAAKIAGVRRETCYQNRKTDPVFRADWEAALWKAADSLNAEVLDVAVNGRLFVVNEAGERIDTTRWLKRYGLRRVIEMLTRLPDPLVDHPSDEVLEAMGRQDHEAEIIPFPGRAAVAERDREAPVAARGR